MKSNIKLNPTMSLKAIESKVRNTSFFISGDRAVVKHNPNQYNPSKPVGSSKDRHTERRAPGFKSLPEIRQSVRRIYEALSRSAKDNEVVKLEETGDRESYKAVITLSEKQGREEQLRTVETYAFYPAAHNAAKLGSVAIYGPDAAARRMDIVRHRSLFGHAIRDARLEMGRRLFVDVTFA